MIIVFIAGFVIGAAGVGALWYWRKTLAAKAEAGIKRVTQ